MEYTRDTGEGFEYEKQHITKIGTYHCHSQIEVIYIVKGQVRLRTDTGYVVYDVYEGEFAVVKSGDVHRIYPNCATDALFIRFPLTYLNIVSDGFVRKSFVVPKNELEKRPALKRTLDSVTALLSEDNTKGVTADLCSVLCSMLQSLYSYRRTVISIGDDESNKSASRTGVSLDTIEKFDKVISYIEENFRFSGLNLQILSDVSGMNKTFLSALFPKLTGRNFKEYVHNLRINYAIGLMSSTERNFSEIAYLCGFETIRSFNNVFKGVLGTTPTGFLSSLRMGDNTGIDVSVDGIGKKLFDYNWTCNVGFSKNPENNSISVVCKDTLLKIWCHLRLKMVFFASKSYRVSFRGRVLGNAAGEICENNRLFCNFFFRDGFTGIEHHAGHLLSAKSEHNGWTLYEYSFDMPDYYKVSTEDNFSVYSEPFNNLGTNFEVRDLIVEPLQ